MAKVYSKIAGTPSGSVEVLAKSNVRQTLAGIVTETVMATYTLPANTLGANDSLRITTLWGQPAGQTGAVQSIIKWGSGYLLNNVITATDSQQTINFVHANNSLTAQKSMGNSFADSYKETGTANQTYAIDTTADVVIDFSGIIAAAEDLYLESYMIELIRA